MEKGIKLKSKSPDVNTFLLSLMNALEASKKVIGPIKDDAGAVTCENFALSIFTKADEEDRAGVATKDTAKTFYAAATFFDILEQFGDLDQEIQEKRRYSKWKAADIINAIKAGKAPTPGAPDEVSIHQYY
jgi:vacuolar protein sorting-associated protein VTA1